MSTGDLAIICPAGVAVAFIAAAWSLAYFKGWRIAVSPPKPGEKKAAADPKDPAGISDVPLAPASEIPAVTQPVRAVSGG